MPQLEAGPTRADLSDDLVREIIDRTSGRSRLVVEEILQRGYVTTVQLSDMGYDHPPRAAADVRDRGIPLLTVMKHVGGKRVGHYRFPDGLSQLDQAASGRVAISRKFRDEVLKHYGVRDSFTGTEVGHREIQIDHRIPYRISGDPIPPLAVDDFMPVSAAMNRAKSWECEACPNWITRDAGTCRTCYWAHPEGPYDHVATRSIRRLDLVWTESEVTDFERLHSEADSRGLEIRDAAKRIIARALRRSEK